MIQASKFAVDPTWRIILKDLGAGEEDILRQAELPLDLLSRKSAFLSADEYFRLWRGLEKTINAPCFPLRIGRSITAETFSPPLFAALCSPNLNVALTRLSQFKQFIGPMTLRVILSHDLQV